MFVLLAVVSDFFVNARASAWSPKECKATPALGRFRNAKRASTWALKKCKARLHLGALEMQSAPSLGRFRNAKPRIRLGALEMQRRASAWALPKCKQAPLSPWTSPRVAKDRWSHPGPLVTSTGDSQAPWVVFCCVSVSHRMLNNFEKILSREISFRCVLACFVCLCVVLFPITNTDNEVFYVERSGIEYGSKTTMYSHFGDEMNLDGRHSHLRCARAGVMNIVHISIGVTKTAVLRVPLLRRKRTVSPSLCLFPKSFDLVVRINRKAYKDTMNAVLKTSVEGSLINVLAYIEELFVSSDFKGTHASSSVEGKPSMVLDGNMVEDVLKYDYNSSSSSHAPCLAAGNGSYSGHVA